MTGRLLLLLLLSFVFGTGLNVKMQFREESITSAKYLNLNENAHECRFCGVTTLEAGLVGI